MYVARSSNWKICRWCAGTNPLKDPLMKFTSPFRVVVAVFLITVVGLAQGPSIPAPPATPKRPVTDEYQGIKITDDYRWLENWDDPEVKQWSTAQNARSREFLDHLPSRPAIRQMLKEALSASSAEPAGRPKRAAGRAAGSRRRAGRTAMATMRAGPGR